MGAYRRGHLPTLHVHHCCVVDDGTGRHRRTTVPASRALPSNSLLLPSPHPPHACPRTSAACLTESVHTIVLQRQFPPKFVNVSFISTCIKNQLTNWCGILLLPNDFQNTFCEISLHRGGGVGMMEWRAAGDRLQSQGVCMQTWVRKLSP